MCDGCDGEASDGKTARCRVRDALTTRPPRAHATATATDGDVDHQRGRAHSKSGHSAARERARSVSSSAAKNAFTVL